jgi:hypothetical protein
MDQAPSTPRPVSPTTRPATSTSCSSSAAQPSRWLRLATAMLSQLHHAHQIASHFCGRRHCGRAVRRRSHVNRRGLTLTLGADRGRALLAQPGRWYDSAIWARQTHSALVLVTVAPGPRQFRGRGRPRGARRAHQAQFGIVLPVVGIVLLRRHLLRPGSGPRHPCLRRGVALVAGTSRGRGDSSRQVPWDSSCCWSSSPRSRSTSSASWADGQDG